jgi:hypothetical protein
MTSFHLLVERIFAGRLEAPKLPDGCQKIASTKNNAHTSSQCGRISAIRSIG